MRFVLRSPVRSGPVPALVRRRLSRLAMAVIVASTTIAAVAPSMVTAQSTRSGPAILPPDAGGGMLGYKLLDISGGAPNLTQIDPVGISNDGVIAGTAIENGQPRPFFWRPAESLQFLPYDGPNANVRAIAPDGTVAGTLQDRQLRGWYSTWKVAQTGTVALPKQVLPTSTGPAELGQVVAATSTGDILTTSHLISGAGTATPLAPAVTPNVGFTAVAVNDAGASAGWTEIDTDGDGSANRSQATLWSGTSPRLLPDPDPGKSSAAVAVNDRGDVALRVLFGNEQDAYVRVGSATTKLGTAERATQVIVKDLNNKGEAVGSAVFPGVGRRAFFWSGGQMIDLNSLVAPDLGWQLQSATGVNDKGQITGDASLNGRATAFVLDPIAPVVFVPGAGASRLALTNADGSEGDERWMACGKNRRRLSLWPEDIASGAADANIAAFDALQKETCFQADRNINPALDVYGTFLDQLRGMDSFHEYDKGRNRNRFTTDGCDMNQRAQRPNLFVFAYDWRRDNAISAAQLKDFIGCAQKFWPNRKVNIVTHSMGSIVARRYVLDNPDAPVERMITMGAPWLGATKLVNVLQTGDFAPLAVNGWPDTIKDIVGSFTASHQLMSARRYHETAITPVFRENGWDINRNGTSYESYSYDQLAAFLNGQQDGRSAPATSASTFQGYSTDRGGQVDWRSDSTGIDYTHIVGNQAGANTIGTVVASQKTVCVIGSWLCSPKRVIEQELVCGDGTVPVVSATRVRQQINLNAPGADVVVFTATNTDQNDSVEHTLLTANSNVMDLVTTLLTTRPDQDPSEGYGSVPADPFPERISCLRSGPAGFSAAASNAPDQAHSLRYVKVLGGTSLNVSSGEQSTKPDQGGYVRNVTLFPSDRADAAMATMPIPSGTPSSVSFTATGDPLEVDVLDGSQAAPISTTRWIDAVVPSGSAVTIEMSSAGTSTLKFDSDGDGQPDTVVPPRLQLTGAAALDITAPEVLVNRTGTQQAPQFVVSATDAESGVDVVLWSTDGNRFFPYTGPITVPAGASKLYTFAQDRAGNRSPIKEQTLDSIARSVTTAAVLAPLPSDSGWNNGPVTVTLRATDANGGTDIRSITTAMSGSTAQPPTASNGATATVNIAAEGTTTLTYFATANDGTVEPARTLQVRVDETVPSVEVKTPANGTVIDALPSLTGTASDLPSGIATVEVELSNPAGQFWNGTGWGASPQWLNTNGTATWSRASGLPSGASLPIGTYRIRARATDAAGRSAITVSSFTVATSAAMIVTALADLPPAVGGSPTAINERGVVVGATPEVDLSGATRWSTGSVSRLSSPIGVRNAVPRDVNDGGVIVGLGTSSSGAGTALQWNAAGVVTVLPSVPDKPAEARAINNAGLIVGSSGNQPVKWIDGKLVVLNPLVGYPDGAANDVNEVGTIVGSSNTAGNSMATLWNDQGPRSLGTLRGGTGSVAAAVNDLGIVVGTSSDDSGRSFAFEYRNDQMTKVSLGLNENVGSKALDINNAGQIVGSYIGATNKPRAFLWSPSAGGIDLNSLVPGNSGWVLEEARDINELGQIAVFGTDNGKGRAFVISTVHPPAANDVAIEAAATGSTAVTLDGWDPNVEDSLTYAIVTPPGKGTLSTPTGSKVSYSPSPGARGVDTFTYRVSDGRFTSGIATVTVTIGSGGANNVPPLAKIAAPTTVTEGETVRLDASGSTDSDGSIASYAWDLNSDGRFDEATGPIVSVPTTDDRTLAATVRVTDNSGAEATASTSVKIANVAPSIASLAASTAATAGQPVRIDGTFTDPSTADQFTATGDFGDGSGPAAATVTGRTITATRTFAVAGTYAVKVTVCDDDRGCGTAEIQVVVGSPLSVSITGPTTVTEGSSIGLTAVPAPAAGGRVVATLWDLDSDGDFGDAQGTTATVAARDNGTVRVRVRITDDAGASATAESSVVVTNVAPTAAGIPGTLSTTTGKAVELAGTIVDPGADSHTVTVDYGTGSPAVSVPVANGSFKVATSYATAGSFAVTVTITDDDGGSSITTTQVAVTATPTGGPGAVLGAGRVAVSGTPNRIDFALGASLDRNGRYLGAVGLVRGSGQSRIELLAATVTSGSVVTVGSTRTATFAGTGQVRKGGVTRRVSFVAVAVDGSTDRVWFQVTDASGKVVPELTLPGTASEPVTLLSGGFAVIKY